MVPGLSWKLMRVCGSSAKAGLTEHTSKNAEKILTIEFLGFMVAS
jgi:hypothetical protein